MLIDIVYAMGPSPEGQGLGGAMGSIIPLILIFVIFYMLLIRPQQKRAKEHRRMVENIRKGDKVITSGGLYGVIESIGTTTVTVKIAENVKVKLVKGHIAAVRPPTEED
ncbi:MAG: preprotein translocase subunit YajC [Nitrospira sp.]|nr:preprotein translocase subunit YajC [Nitrospira sp.]